MNTIDDITSITMTERMKDEIIKLSRVDRHFKSHVSEIKYMHIVTGPNGHVARLCMCIMIKDGSGIWILVQP